MDSGDIISQKELEILPSDTADTLYKKVKKLELEIFKQTWPSIVSKTYNRTIQRLDRVTHHKKNDLSKEQLIDLDKNIKAEELINRLRALTTSNIDESAYFEKDGKLYHIQVSIKENNNSEKYE